jgi:hypothetical protein
VAGVAVQLTFGSVVVLEGGPFHSRASRRSALVVEEING